MIDPESARVLAHSGMALAGILGAGLTVSVGFAATVPVHEPIRTTLARVWTWGRKGLSVALGALWAVVALPYRLAVTYLHVGWRRQRHAYVTRGRHRPAYIAANPWRPVLRWRPDGYTPYIEWTYPA
jgi:hypothetical protein